MPILQLPDEVIAQIQSSVTITSLNGAICGLVQNSLDAGATKIHISVDYARGGCSVEDDGLGIQPAEFRADGGLGKLHYTSKFPPRDGIHGKHGVFLHSLASMSLLSVTSHHHAHHSHNSIRIHHSSVLSRHTPSPPDQRLLTFTHGTRVTVRDLFGSLPVRVKQRAIDLGRGASTKDWGRLRHALSALLLAWPGQVSLSIRESVNQWSVSIRSPEISVKASDRPSGNADYTYRVSRVLYQSQLSDDILLGSWVPLRASIGSLSVAGAISLSPVPTRKVQFLSIGIQPVSNDHASNVLYEEINRAFVNSNFGVEEGVRDIDEDEQQRRAKDGRHKTDGFTNQELRARKGVDRWPMFYININIEDPDSPVLRGNVKHILEENRESLASIIELLSAVIYEFLKKHQFRPKMSRPSKTATRTRNGSCDAWVRPTSRDMIGDTTLKKTQKKSRSMSAHNERLAGDSKHLRLRPTYNEKSRSRTESPFDFWTRIKSGQPLPTKLGGQSCDIPGPGPTSSTQITAGERGRTSSTPLLASDGLLLRVPFPDVEDSSNAGTNNGAASQNKTSTKLREDEVSWTDPATGETSIINRRTGFIVLPQRENKDCEGDATGGNQLGQRKRLRTNTRPAHRETRSTWLGDLLSSWDNPVFEATEPPIPAAIEETQMTGLMPKTANSGCHCAVSGHTGALPSVSGRVSKDALRKAEVISQVDQKFILVKVSLKESEVSSGTGNDAAGSLLIVVDQHAADERCRVETLMKNYFEISGPARTSDTGKAQPEPVIRSMKARSERLEAPVIFDVSARDASEFERLAGYFEYWGIVYHISRTGNRGPKQLKITDLPTSIAERCRVEPQLLNELLRKEVWRRDEQDHEGVRRPASEPMEEGISYSDDGPGHWLARLHGCPQGIMDMINSRACRSSIMFNDPLRHEECVHLLSQLADCVFPFQCAHGRPSMVPLVDLGRASLRDARPKPQGDGFGVAYRKWKREAGGGTSRDV
ncbi:hypothetical protein GGR56DRAFT_613399 [Xylariaceae sp. FL0804]|nr:hypothetical protein GGR56DRAFT_613399 [Xylariaceae sp. FL0804]